MIRLHTGLAAIAMVTVTAWGLPALAGGGTEPQYRTQNQIDLHVRYPGDSSYSFGTYRHRGPDQGPYVERCTWSAKSNLWGLPLGLTQTCIRYTDDTTN